ncbi:MAG: hypothetical protein ACTJG2_00900 [Candidatus Saccharimonadales bacterium]
MTVQPVSSLLRRINKDSSHFYTVTGCQLLFTEATRSYDQVTAQVHHVESIHRVLGEMAEECRAVLRQWQWRTQPGCSRHSTACRTGTCGCSYQWIARLSALIDVQKEKERELRALKHDAACYRQVASKVIAGHFMQICTVPLFVLGFAEVMHLTGSISDDEWNFINTFGDDAILHGTPFNPHLTVGTFNQSLTIQWDQFGNRIYP